MLKTEDNWINRIHCGDILTILRQMPDEFVDLVITSPPFNIGIHVTCGKRHYPYDDNMPEPSYQEWQTKVLTELSRVTKVDGSLFYQHKNRIRQGRLITPYEWLLNPKIGWVIKQEIVWRNGGPNMDKRRFFPQTERIYWLTKKKETVLINSLNITDLWLYQPVGTGKGHTRQFPEELVDNIISCFPDAKVILDPFMGSGTTALVALKNHRDFVGIEINPAYVDMSRKRIQTIQSKLI